MSDILNTILARKAEEVAARRAAVPLAQLQARLADAPPLRGFARALHESIAFGEAAVIAKRSHPLIHEYAKKLEVKHGKFVANAILANKLARAMYFMLKSGTGFDVERLIATSI